jgi:hypothetical protein
LPDTALTQEVIFKCCCYWEEKRIIIINPTGFLHVMTNSPLDERVLQMFQNETKDLLGQLVAHTVGTGEPQLIGLCTISGGYHFTVLHTQEKQIVPHLNTLCDPGSLAEVKKYVAQKIAQFQKIRNTPLVQGDVPFFLYAMHLIESLEQRYDAQTVGFLKGIMKYTILEHTCPILAETLPSNFTAIFHHHIYDTLRSPSEHETHYAVPSYVVVTGLDHCVSTLYRCGDKKTSVIGAIAHSQKTRDVLTLRKRPKITYDDKDKDFLRFVANSDYYLRGIGAYKLNGTSLIPICEPRFFGESTSTAYLFVRCSDIKPTDTILAFAVDEHYRTAVAARMPQQNISLRNAGVGMI